MAEEKEKEEESKNIWTNDFVKKIRDKIFFFFFHRYAVYFRNKMLDALTSYFSLRNQTSFLRTELKQIFPLVKKKKKKSP